jgi:hypothetical protein
MSTWVQQRREGRRREVAGARERCIKAKKEAGCQGFPYELKIGGAAAVHYSEAVACVTGKGEGREEEEEEGNPQQLSSLQRAG